jgi:phosphoribosylformylglycinamidine cyclo-ligase
MKLNSKSMTYKSTGVNYKLMDPIKKFAQSAAKKTSFNLLPLGMSEIEASRGESAYVWEEPDSHRAFVMEGLGTKNIVADETAKITHKNYYHQIAQDTVAMIINDLIVVGAKPQILNAYFAIGSSDWFLDTIRAKKLISGWKDACNLAGVVWGGGETPTLKDIINPNTIDLGGSAIGIIKPKKRLVLGDKLSSGDIILLIESSGIHANGLTLARSIASTLPKGYATKLDNGQIYGEAILTPTHIYAKIVNKLLNNNIDIHYMVNITGHGWRKLMRANKKFSYIIDQIPPIPPIFGFIQKHSKNNDEEMYGNFNMGAGFAIFVSPKDSNKTQKIIKDKSKFKVWQSGVVKTGPKQVIIKPKNIIFSEKTLEVR